MIPPIVTKLEEKFWRQIVGSVFRELAFSTEDELRELYLQCMDADCENITGVLTVTVAGCAIALLKDKYGVDIQAETTRTE